MTRMTVEQLRQDLPMTGEIAYFQTGTYGPASDSVLQAVRETLETEARHGPATTAGRLAHRDGEAAARSGLARMLNVKEEELSIDTNTSRAMQQIVRGLIWQPGDEFVMTSLEHVSTYGLSYSLTEEHGVTVKVIEAERLTDEELLAELAGALTDRTRLICLSHVASPNGRLLPVKEAAAIAHEAGVPVMLDLAQSVGTMPVDLQELDCDFAVGSGHKWLLGPMGTGYIFVAEHQIPGFRPNFIPDRSPWTLAGDPTPPPTARSRTEIGTYNHALVVGLGRAVEILQDIGLDVIQTRIADLTRRLRRGVEQIDRARLITPLEPEKSAGITSVMFDGYTKTDMDGLAAQLQDRHQALVKSQWLTAPPDPVKIAMRISVAAFNDEGEVDRLLEGIDEEL
ncbi:MAG: aminotransferase class V-fold PLP-dependent enzyme [Caldilineaceae bacterium]|nr:aminotransferase class V-fold PLP-dependent enzyme [Caldilineaceae bacterium]